VKKRTWRNNVITLTAAIAVCLAVWAIAYAVVGNDLLLPSFADCMRAAGELLVSSVFWTAFFSTLLRVLIAFCISFVFAAIFAVIAYMVPTFRAFFAPIIAIIRSMPVLAVLLVILVWTNGGVAPVIVAFLSLFPMLYTGILAAFSGIDQDVLEISRLHGASVFTQVFKIYLPLSSPYILRESAAALSFSLKLVVSAEVVANTARSLGGLMQDAQGYDLPRLFALVIITFIVGLLLELLVGAFMTKVDKA
jgi:NitT/TauT family transport system permease protein